MARGAAVLFLLLGGNFGEAEAKSLDIKAAKDSVVRVVTIIDENSMGTGSGFLVFGKRIVATNAHVVARGKHFVLLFKRDNKPAQAVARLRVALPEQDLAILESDEDLPGDANVLALTAPEITDHVVAIGFPAIADALGNTSGKLNNSAGMDPNLVEATVTSGDVQRVIRVDDPHALMVQHSAPINGGNSGGPLFDRCGRVVGVNTLKLTKVDPKLGVVTDNIQGIFASVQAVELQQIMLRHNYTPRTNNGTCGAGVLGALPDWGYTVFGSFLALMLGTTLLFVAWRGNPIPFGNFTQVLTGLRTNLTRRHMLTETQHIGPSGTLELIPLGAGAPVAINLSRLSGGGRVFIGRDPSSDLVLPQSAVSKTHARAWIDTVGNLRIEDAGSANGLKHGAARIKQAVINSGDVITFGDAAYRVRINHTAVAAGQLDQKRWILSGFDGVGKVVQHALTPNAGADETTWRIGRKPDQNDLVLSDDSVSRVHAALRCTARGDLEIRDLGSRGGTYVDSVRIGASYVFVKSGQTLQFGSLKLSVSVR